MKSALFIFLATLVPCTADAQHSPYSGHERREIKGLSAEEVEQYLSGAGMEFAKAAELNRFPGPMHVLELSDRLELTTEQRESAKRLMDRHKADARTIGAKLIEAEGALDRLFASGSVGGRQLAEQVKIVAALQGEYRLSHLETHRQMRTILTPEQVDRYDVLRGYRIGGYAPGTGHPAQH